VIEMDKNQAPAIRETFRFVGEVGPLFEALAKAQAEFVPMERDSEVGFQSAKGGRTFRYASLAEVLDSVRPALNKHGIALLQPFDGNEVVSMLCFGAARFEVSVILPEWKGVQELGSALTYVKRYQLKSLLGVNDGEDDDGNAADGTGRQPEPRTRANPPANRPAPKEAQAPVNGAITAPTKTKVWDLALKAGFSTAELEEFSKKHGLGALGGLSEQNGLTLAGKLQELQVQK